MMMAQYDGVNVGALKKLVAAGTELRPFTPEIMTACYAAANQTYEEYSAANPAFKKIHDSYMAYRNDSYLWWQVAELGYDSFMVRARRG